MLDNYVYMHIEKNTSTGYRHWLKVWRIRRNTLKVVGSMTYGSGFQQDQAVCSLLAGSLPDEFGKFPDSFVCSGSTTLNKDRTYLHHISGYTENYPAYLLHTQELNLMEITPPSAGDANLIVR